MFKNVIVICQSKSEIENLFNFWNGHGITWCSGEALLNDDGSLHITHTADAFELYEDGVCWFNTEDYGPTDSDWDTEDYKKMKQNGLFFCDCEDYLAFVDPDSYRQLNISSLSSLL